MRLLDFGNVFPSVLNTIVVGSMAVIFISIMKYVTALYKIPGISELMSSI